jgi:hypothetical protein
VAAVYRVRRAEPVPIVLYELVSDDNFAANVGLGIGKEARMNWSELSPLLILVAYFAIMRWVLPRFGVST